MKSTENISITNQKRWQTVWDFFQEQENFFKQQEQDYENTQKAYQHIVSTIDHALISKDYASLSALISYIETGDGFLAYEYIGKTHRLLRIINIITLEIKCQKDPFCQDCHTFEELYEKYMLTVFAFRRLLFQLSPESADEAAAYLRNRPISHFAAFWIMEGDLLIPCRNLCENLTAIYADVWSPADIQQFFDLIITLPNADFREEIYEQS